MEEQIEYTQDQIGIWEKMRVGCEHIYEQTTIDGELINNWCQHPRVYIDDACPEDCLMEYCPLLKGGGL